MVGDIHCAYIDLDEVLTRIVLRRGVKGVALIGLDNNPTLCVHSVGAVSLLEIKRNVWSKMVGIYPIVLSLDNVVKIGYEV